MKQPYVAVLIVFATVTPLLVGVVDTASRRRYPVLFQPESNEGKAIPATGRASSWRAFLHRLQLKSWAVNR